MTRAIRVLILKTDLTRLPTGQANGPAAALMVPPSNVRHTVCSMDVLETREVHKSIHMPPFPVQSGSQAIQRTA